MPIHATAIVDPAAEIDSSAEIGAYAIVEKDVRILAGARVYPHAYIAQGTTLGERCEVHPFAVVGHLPQDLKFEGASSYTRIGEATIIREHATIHRGTMPGSTTVVGRGCFIMSAGHIGHNCTVGDHVTMANGTMLAGHVEIGDRAFLSGNAMVHQFVRVGELVIASGGARVTNDVPPFMTVCPTGVVGPNVVGLRRAGLTSEERHEIRRAYKTLYRTGLPFSKAIELVAEMVQTAPGRRLMDFLRSPSKRTYMSYKGVGRPEAQVAE